MLYILMTKGLKYSVCDQGFYNGPVSKFWAYAFVLSKAPELGECLLSFRFLPPTPFVATHPQYLFLNGPRNNFEGPVLLVVGKSRLMTF